MTVAIIIPVKSPRRAKHRLEPVLGEPDRVRLARVMARDVFGTVSTLNAYGRFVISDDPEVLDEGRRFGLEPLTDRVGQGQSAAVQQGFAAAWERGFAAAVTIPGDVPAVTGAELAEFCDYRPEIEVLLAPDRERIGTNGLRLVPPHAITLRFGEDSFSLHQAEARRANRSLAVKEVEGLRYDLDRPEDIIAFLSLPRDTETLRLLQELRVAERVALATTPSNG
ncbi:MAG TPA: 2-phospho-L-lactate guanylyltransferase [Candidatus Dormibacteraeota bacterium]